MWKNFSPEMLVGDTEVVVAVAVEKSHIVGKPQKKKKIQEMSHSTVARRQRVAVVGPAAGFGSPSASSLLAAPAPAPSFPARLPTAVGLHALGFLSLLNLANLAACAPATRKLVAAHLARTTTVSCGRDSAHDRDQERPRIGEREYADCRDDGAADYDQDGNRIRVARSGSFGADEGEHDATTSDRPAWTVHYALTLLCRYARRMHTLDLSRLPAYSSPLTTESAATNVAWQSRLARLVLENRATLRRVEIPRVLRSLAFATALGECMELRDLDSDGCSWYSDVVVGSASTASGGAGGGGGGGGKGGGGGYRETSASARDRRTAFSAAVQTVFAAATKLESATFVCDCSTSPLMRLFHRSLHQCLEASHRQPRTTLSRLTLRNASVGHVSEISGRQFPRLARLELQLAEPFGVVCSAVAHLLLRLPKLVDFRLRVQNATSRSQPPAPSDQGDDAPEIDDDAMHHRFRANDSTHRRSYRGATWRSLSVEKITLWSGDSDAGGWRELPSHWPRIGGRELPRHWPRIVAPELREFRGQVDLGTLTHVWRRSPLLEVVDCARADCEMPDGAAFSTGDLADYEANFDTLGHLLLDERTETDFCEVLGAPASASSSVATFRFVGLPFSARMLAAVARNCTHLAYFKVHVASTHVAALRNLLERRATSLRVCTLTALTIRNEDYRGRASEPRDIEVNACLRHPAPQLELACVVDWRPITMPFLKRLALPRGWWAPVDAPQLLNFSPTVPLGARLDRVLRHYGHCREMTLDLDLVARLVLVRETKEEAVDVGQLGITDCYALTELSRLGDVWCAPRDAHGTRDAQGTLDRNAAPLSELAAMASSFPAPSPSPSSSPSPTARSPSSSACPPSSATNTLSLVNVRATDTLHDVFSWFPALTELRLTYVAHISATDCESAIARLETVLPLHFAQLRTLAVEVGQDIAMVAACPHLSNVRVPQTIAAGLAADLATQLNAILASRRGPQT